MVQTYSPHEAPFEKAGYIFIHQGDPLYLLTPSSIPVVFYDQIGNGESSHIKNKPDTFWRAELFMDELDNLLKKLEIYDNFELLGHSWGG